MMFSDEEIKESSFMRPGDEIISIREVCLIDKFDKKDFAIHNEGLLPSSSRNDPFREGFFDGLEQQQARFAWTEEDGNIASLVSEPGFGTTGQTTFGKEIDAAMKSDMKEPDTSSSALNSTSFSGSYGSSISKSSDSQLVTSTSTGSGLGLSKGQGCKVDKADPRSRVHFVKYVKRHGRTVKLWECGICSREFQHQYTLMRHLPTHTDERNFHCVACGKSFRQLSTLSQHRAIHSAERPYACELCNKTFNRVSTLISHRKTHSDEKPYKCHICFKGFHQKGNLRNHLFTHTNERPYRCNICLKGFNQQSNLVCHKNKAHPNDVPGSQVTRGRSTPRITRPPPETRPDSTRSQIEHCEVSSSVGPYLPSVEGPSSSFWHKPNIWDLSKTYGAENAWNMENPWSNLGTGVIVDPIKTYHMGVALAKKQTPFALLKPDNGNPVLVKVVDTHLPGGQQMLVPATAEDLRVGGKIVMKEDDSLVESIKAESSELGGAVQIRVPVVATVVPKISPGGRLHLSVEEPHHAYHTALSADVGDMSAPLCSAPPPACTRAPSASLPSLTPQPKHQYSDVMKTGGQIISSTCALPPPAPSPPLDLIPMDLFEPMECIPMGPQVTAVGDIEAPPSDESDIFIGKFEESIPLSDSD